MQELRDQPVPNIQYGIRHIYEDVTSGLLERAERAGLNEAKKCLDGTRTEILNEIIDWIDNEDADTPRIFWLYGQAGKGKSAIAHTIALHARNLGCSDRASVSVALDSTKDSTRNSSRPSHMS